MKVRECFIPRKGLVFAQADYEGLELHTWAQFCIRVLGMSDLADVLNAGRDPHTELAAEILDGDLEEAYKRKKDKNDQEFINARQAAKVANFGLPGGLGAKRFVDFARSTYKVTLAPTQEEAEAKARGIKAAWLRRWREARPYFDYVDRMSKNAEGFATLIDPFSGAVRGNVGYTNACNDGFQRLGANAAKRGLWLVTKACFTDRASPLYGSRPVNFIHDEIILETADDERAHDAAHELSRLMIAGANEWLPDVRAKAPPLLMRFWSKNAVECHDERGRLVPWEDAPCCVEGCKGKAIKRLYGAWTCSSHETDTRAHLTEAAKAVGA